MKTVKVLYKEPGKSPRYIEVYDQLSSYQNLVFGYIECLTLMSDVAVICNEEGRIKNMQYNCSICNLDFYGPIALVGIDGEEFCDCPIEESFIPRVFKRIGDF